MQKDTLDNIDSTINELCNWVKKYASEITPDGDDIVFSEVVKGLGTLVQARAEMGECMRVTVAEAAEIIGCRKEIIHSKMKRGEWDLGQAIKPKRAGGNYHYIIFRPKLEKFLGIEKSL